MTTVTIRVGLDLGCSYGDRASSAPAGGMWPMGLKIRRLLNQSTLPWLLLHCLARPPCPASVSECERTQIWPDHLAR